MGGGESGKRTRRIITTHDNRPPSTMARRPAAQQQAQATLSRRSGRGKFPLKLGIRQIAFALLLLATVSFLVLPLLVHRLNIHEANYGGRLRAIAPDKKEQHTEEAKKAAIPEQSTMSYHFIVSSDCSSYQQWETLTQLHSAQAIHQCGRYTWIVSGCLPDGQEGKGKGGAGSDILTEALMIAELAKNFPSDDDSERCAVRPMLHFTPDYSDMSVYGGPYADGTKKRTFVGRNGKVQHSNFMNHYKFNNKPNGFKHWAEHNDLTANEAVVLIDPDFLFLSPFRLPNNVRHGSLESYVGPGRPAAASYGLGAQWVDFDRVAICGAGSACTNTTEQDVRRYYSAGPPYIIHSSDVLALATKWAELVPPTYDQYPLLYAEMFAYSMAAAHLNLKHSLVNGLFTGCMVGWPGGEAEAVAASARRYKESVGKEGAMVTGAIQVGATGCFLPPMVPPPFLHYCTRYAFSAADDDGKATNQEAAVKYHFFAKRRVDHTILKCDHQPLEPFVSDKEEHIQHGNKDWNTLAVCAVVRAVNYARYRRCGSS